MKELPANVIGEHRCERLNDRVRVCVFAGRYSISGAIVDAAGNRIAPISIGRGARSIGAAMNVARQAARRIMAGRPQRRRR